MESPRHFENHRSFLSRLIGPALILLAALLAIAPQLIRGNSCGHDFDFHLVSWLDAENAWQHGIPYPHWTPTPNYGAGEPRFVFYPPLTWMMGAALGWLLGWQWASVALTFLLLAGTGLGIWALAREKLDQGAATLAGCAAIFSGYALFVAYERSAFAELAGGFWIALLLKFALREPESAQTSMSSSLPFWARRALDNACVPLALVVAGAWLSNPTVGVMSCYLLAAVALAASLLSRSLAPALRALVATPLGIGLAGVYLVPVAAEQRWADLNQVNLSPGQTLENNWLFARHANPVLAFHDQVLRQVSYIAVAMIVISLIAIPLCHLRSRLPGQRSWWLPLAMIPPVVLLLLLPISEPLWNLLPKMRYLQFPWRWLVVLEAPIGVFVAAAVWPASGSRSAWKRCAVAPAFCAVFAGLTLTANTDWFQVCDDEDAVPGMLALYRSGAGVEGQDEYVPPGADNSELATGLPDACLVTDPDAKLGVEQKPDPDASPDDNPPPPLWQASQGSCDATFNVVPSGAIRAEAFTIHATTSHAGYLILHRRSYPAWRVKVNGQIITSLPQRDDGLIAVAVPQGTVDLTVNWTATPDVVAGRWLSGLSAVLLAAVWWITRKQSRRGLS
jgi:hypothetical protein